MKIMALLFPMFLAMLAAQTAPAPVEDAYPVMAKHKTIPIYAETPYGQVTVWTAGDLCVVVLGSRVIGPMPTLDLAVPGQQSATAGVSVCVVTFLPGGGGFFSTVTLSNDAPTLGQAVSACKDQIDGLLADPDKAVLPMSECEGGQG